jgi:hypothetical protein
MKPAIKAIIQDKPVIKEIIQDKPAIISLQGSYNPLSRAGKLYDTHLLYDKHQLYYSGYGTDMKPTIKSIEV